MQAFIEADARIPAEVSLPSPAHREVARILAERRNFPVTEVVGAIAVFGQPELLETNERHVGAENLRGETQTDMAVAPISKVLLI